jgi:HEAT repeat protein
MIQSRALTRLIKDLLHPDASKRRSAAEELSQTDERAVYPLIKALRDENPGVQDAAMRSLISIGGETTVYMVLPLLREDSYLRNTAIIILKDIGAAAVPLLYPLLKDKDEDIRKFSVDLLMDIREGVSPEKISPLLHDPNPNVRASAAKAAGALGYRDAVPDLLQALHDDEWVCFSALEALGELKEETTADAVAGLLSGSPGPVRYAAVEALGKIGSTRSVTALMEHLDKADDLEKASVVKGLLQLGAAHSVPGVTGILVEMLENSGWEDKIISLKGIAELKACETIKSILDVGGSLDPSDPESEERLEVIRETLRSLACTHAFVDALDDPDIRYRGRVIAVRKGGAAAFAAP